MIFKGKTKMKYFKVKKESDQRSRIDGSILIANELYTEKELKKYKINPVNVVPVEIPKTKVYFCFGARFA